MGNPVYEEKCPAMLPKIELLFERERKKKELIL